MRYAQINFDNNQMIGPARQLPARWTTPDGATISNFNKLPQAALYGLGWVPVTHEVIADIDAYKHSLSPAYDTTTKQFNYPAEPRDINVLKAASRKDIDGAAATTSARYITVGAGQGMRYLKKLAVVEKFLAAIAASETPDINDYPILKAEADAMGESYTTRAQVIIDIAAAWEVIAAGIEAARISGKAAVTAADTNANVITARDTAIAALEVI